MTKIFMAVVAGMFAFSCVTDTTEDLGVKVEGQGVTELALSLEESRTHLGEKAEGVYPLYWSEGDAIAVNGTASNPLAAGGEATATFSFAEEVTAPLHIVYPASEGANVVNFLAEQPYTVGTFAPQAAPMYGYAAELPESGIELHHLTGVLRLAIAGNGEKVTSIKAVAQNGKIAGAYTVDCTNGTLTPSAEATNIVTVTFAEPLVLGAEATPVYLTVPAGKYGTFVITVNTEAHEKMTVKFNSDVKPINAGAVREFKEFTYAANTNDEEGVFIIDSEEALIKFAKMVGTDTFYPKTSAKVTASIDMSGYNWTPIEGFGAYEFDGGSEEGYTIKGLNAPLFATTTATIKNVKLEDVNINIAKAISSNGALVRVLSGGTIENCEVSGSMTINGGNYSYGGIVGLVNGPSTLKDLTNRCSVTVTIDDNKETHLGGILGRTSKTLTISNCDNYGAMTVSGTDTYKLRVGGVIGYLASGGETTADDINNHGEVTVTHAQGHDSHVAGIFGSALAAASLKNSSNFVGGKVFVKGNPGGSNTGGVIGYASQPIDIENCHNCDSVKINITTNGSAMLGGIIGYNNTAATKVIKNTSNSGVVFAEGTISGDSQHIRAGGLFGYCKGGTTLTSLTNSGAVTIKISSDEVYLGGISGETSSLTAETLTNSAKITYEGTCAGPCRIGGCLGNGSGTYTTLENTGEIVVTGTTTADYMYVGGVVGINSATLNGMINRGTMNLNGSSKKIYQVGGVIGYTSGKITTATNYGELNFDGTSSSAFCAGGVVGYLANDSCTGLTNESTGTLAVGGTAATYHAVGGVVGQADTAVSGATNSGAVTFGGTSGTMYYAGGVVGSTTKTLTSLTNNGSVTFNGTAVQNHNVGGVVGKAECTALTTLENKAAVTFAGQTTTGTKPEYSDNTCTSFGGVVGVIMGTADALCEVSGLTNSGVTTIGALNQGLKTGYSNLGGVIGYAIYCNLDNCDNTATEFKQEATATIFKLEYGSNKHGVYIGGVAGYCIEMGTIKNCDNSATLNLNANNAIHHYIGCLFGSVETSSTTFVEVSECSNSGNFAPGATFTTKRFRLGGVTGTNKNVNYTQCSNSGIISYTPGTVLTNQFYCGGLFGVLSGGATSCINTGDITLGKNTTTSSATTYIGGLVGSNSGNCKDSHSLCDMTIDGEWVNTGALIGGAVGTTSKPLDNVTVFCKITAIGRSGKVGMVEGKAYAEASKATNCKIGGSLIFATQESVDTDGNEEVLDVVTTLDASNWFEHIYTAAITEEVATGDGCSLLTEKPAVPAN
ncbi:MAG: hypothetical protein IKB90_08545 [Alistipes sp.]|nr:hypothetical protein [Alistipes sp.]